MLVPSRDFITLEKQVQVSLDPAQLEKARHFFLLVTSALHNFHKLWDDRTIYKRLRTASKIFLAKRVGRVTASLPWRKKTNSSPVLDVVSEVLSSNFLFQILARRCLALSYLFQTYPFIFPELGGSCAHFLQLGCRVHVHEEGNVQQREYPQQPKNESSSFHCLIGIKFSKHDSVCTQEWPVHFLNLLRDHWPPNFLLKRNNCSSDFFLKIIRVVTLRRMSRPSFFLGVRIQLKSRLYPQRSCYGWRAQSHCYWGKTL